MKVAFAIMCVLSLCACARFDDSYNPRLAQIPKDAAKYERDRVVCVADANKRREAADKANAGINLTSFGLAGTMADAMMNDQKDDYHITRKQMVDQCITSKGYIILN